MTDQIVFGPDLARTAQPHRSTEEDIQQERQIEAIYAERAAQQAREARVRRALAREGAHLRKDRARKWAGQDMNHQGGYMIVDFGNWIIAGRNFDLTLEQVEEHAGLLRSAG